MSLRRRIMLINAVVLAAVFGLTFIFAVLALRHSLNAEKDRALANIAKLTTSAIRDRELIVAGSAEIISDQAWLAKTLRAGDRAALLQGTQRTFEHMRSAYGANLLQFFTPPAEAILFVENPDMPVKDFRATRPMVIASTVHGVSQRGMELGPAGLAIRGIAPIKDEAGLVGVVEYASDFQALLKQVSVLTDSQMATFIDDDLWNKARQSDKEFTPARDQVLDGKRAVYSTDWDLTSAAVTPDIIAPTRGNRSTSRVINGAEYGVLTMPLIDYSGQQIGFIVSVSSFVRLNTAYVDNVRLAVMRFLLGFILVFGWVTILINSLLLRPLADLQGKLRQLIHGKADEPIAVPGRKDEIGSLFETAEQVRQRLHAAAESAPRSP
ncbi:cache domain-containing protein [Dyella koreensis]|uniref:HAMP domain-containing protein n=1 Tax=Dyella koreensis TaxID=311235 RepID=A0ABW8K7L4_9GAMM